MLTAEEIEEISNILNSDEIYRNCVKSHPEIKSLIISVILSASTKTQEKIIEKLNELRIGKQIINCQCGQTEELWQFKLSDLQKALSPPQTKDVKSGTPKERFAKARKEMEDVKKAFNKPELRGFRL